MIDWTSDFLELIRQGKGVGEASDLLCIDRSTPYKRAKRDPCFEEDWQAAEKEAVAAARARRARRRLKNTA